MDRTYFSPVIYARQCSHTCVLSLRQAVGIAKDIAVDNRCMTSSCSKSTCLRIAKSTLLSLLELAADEACSLASSYFAAFDEPLRLDRLIAHVWWRLGSLRTCTHCRHRGTFPMADISSHLGWLGVRPNPASWFSLLRRHETKTLGPVAVVELRAYHSAGDGIVHPSRLLTLPYNSIFLSSSRNVMPAISLRNDSWPAY